jgi:hypothetical protein
MPLQVTRTDAYRTMEAGAVLQFVRWLGPREFNAGSYALYLRRLGESMMRTIDSDTPLVVTRDDVRTLEEILQCVVDCRSLDDRDHEDLDDVDLFDNL